MPAFYNNKNQKYAGYSLNVDAPYYTSLNDVHEQREQLQFSHIRGFIYSDLRIAFVWYLWTCVGVCLLFVCLLLDQLPKIKYTLCNCLSVSPSLTQIKYLSSNARVCFLHLIVNQMDTRK